MQASRPLTVAGAAQVGVSSGRRATSCFPFNLADTTGDQSTNSADANRQPLARPWQRAWLHPTRAMTGRTRHLQWPAIQEAAQPMSRLEDLAERIERLVLRHEELQRTNALLTQQVASVTSERDSLRSRLAAARARIDALLDRLPADALVSAPLVAPALRQGTPPKQDAA